jgi:hypothetical protein
MPPGSPPLAELEAAGEVNSSMRFDRQKVSQPPTTELSADTAASRAAGEINFSRRAAAEISDRSS